jgi:hypothetical protein
MDALQLLEEVARVEPVDPDVLERTADALRVAAALDARGDTVDTRSAPDLRRPASPPRSFGRRPGRWRLRTLQGAAIIVVVGLAIGLTAVSRPGSPGGPAPAAAAVLKQLALVAADQPAVIVPAPGQFLYVESDEAYQSETAGLPPGGKGSYSVLLPEHRQIWVGPDGSGRLFETYGEPVFLSARDHAAWLAAGSPSIPHAPSDTTFGPGGLYLMKLSDLPTDPSALAADLSSRKIEGGPPGAAEDFTQIGDLLRETDASPALRSALYQVAAALPGVQSLGSVTDHSGRTGVGVAYVDHGVQDELVFDPQTSALLGEQNTVVGPGANYPVGTVVDWVVYLQSAVVDSTTSTAAADAPEPISPSTSPAGVSLSPSNPGDLKGTTAP